MELNTATLGDFVKLAAVLWQKGFDSVPQVMQGSGLFKSMPIPAMTGNTREFSEIDSQEYAKEKPQGDQAERAQVQQGYSATMTSKRVALDIGITYEHRTQNKYPEITEQLTGSGKQVSLASTAHTLRGSSTTYRNILANNPRLSKGALEAIERLAVEETFNQFGEKMTMSFDILWTTDDPNTVNTAREYLQSTADVEGAHSGIKNVYMSKYRHVVLPRVATDNVGSPDTDKRYYWGIASSAMTTAKIGIWEAPRLKVPANLNAGEEFSTDDWNFGVRGGYGIVIISAAWFKISKGNGDA